MARTSCETMVLSKDGFATVLERYPEIEQELRNASNQRQQDTQAATKALERCNQRRKSACACGSAPPQQGPAEPRRASCGGETRRPGSVSEWQKLSLGFAASRRFSLVGDASCRLASRSGGAAGERTSAASRPSHSARGGEDSPRCDDY